MSRAEMTTASLSWPDALSRLTVRILVTNYAIPAAYLAARDRDVFEFQVPIGSIKEDMSLHRPPRRTHAKSADLAGYSLEVDNLPWGNGPTKSCDTELTAYQWRGRSIK